MDKQLLEILKKRRRVLRSAVKANVDIFWSPIVGCSKISAGCQNCYAERQAVRLRGITDAQCLRNRSQRNLTNAIAYGKVTAKNKWTGETALRRHELTKPQHWRKPRKIFVVSMGDLFHESVPFEWIDRVFAVMALCPQHQFMCLTKRAGRMREYIASVRHEPRINHAIIAMDEKYTANFVKHPLPNVHLGVTVENQDNVGRIADLIQTPAAKRFVSFEPLLGKIDFRETMHDGRFCGDFIDYAFIGCESGPRARLCTLEDIWYITGQCGIAGGYIKQHIKQIPLNGKCNKKIKEWSPEFQIREI